MPLQESKPSIINQKLQHEEVVNMDSKVIAHTINANEPNTSGGPSNTGNLWQTIQKIEQEYLAELQSLEKDHHKQIETLRSEILNKAQQITTLNTNLQNLQQENSQLKQKIQSAQQSTVDASELTKIRTELQSKNTELQKLKDELLQLQSKPQSDPSSEIIISQLKSELSEKTQLLQESEAKNKELLSSKEELQNQVLTLQKQLIDTQNEKEELKKQIQETSNNLEKVKSETRTEQEAKIAQLRQEWEAKLAESQAEAANQKQEQETKYLALETENNQLKEEIRAKEGQALILENTQKSVSNLENKLTEAEDLKNKNQQTIQELQSKLSELEKDLLVQKEATQKATESADNLAQTNKVLAQKIQEYNAEKARTASSNIKNEPNAKPSTTSKVENSLNSLIKHLQEAPSLDHASTQSQSSSPINLNRDIPQNTSQTLTDSASAPAKKGPNDKKIITELKFAQIPTITNLANVINGIVYDKNGNILQNAIIIVKDVDKSPVRALKSNRLGQFAISTPLPNGVYTIEVEDSKEESTYDIFQITLSGSVVSPIEIRSTAG